MPQIKPREGRSKSQRYHRAQRRDGMKLVRIWVPDPSVPGFREEAVRQAALLKGAPEETEALDFIASAFDWPEP
ncbi:antitoxin MazE family protein [Methylobacterium sp. J-030]|uniref:antitoxin MazE family protein n=1 Tax=Methylobacterium sp. J-030 TaxID=2836627 RepID=UPI001FBA454D|nr:antitoxin MazE family protein [Methylobacterium sp. J-030]MCJ2072813.1 antitoxin MazE family protein [Methylobacterium sp. J-030]